MHTAAPTDAPLPARVLSAFGWGTSDALIIPLLPGAPTCELSMLSVSRFSLCAQPFETCLMQRILKAGSRPPPYDCHYSSNGTERCALLSTQTMRFSP